MSGRVSRALRREMRAKVQPMKVVATKRGAVTLLVLCCVLGAAAGVVGEHFLWRPARRGDTDGCQRVATTRVETNHTRALLPTENR